MRLKTSVKSIGNSNTIFFPSITVLNMTPNLKHRRINEYNDMLCIDLDNESETHLFRHASEITRETKGGYLKGKISIPMTDKPCYVRLSLVPAERDVNNEFDLHPNLLHINLRQNKKTRRLEVSFDNEKQD